MSDPSAPTRSHKSRMPSLSIPKRQERPATTTTTTTTTPWIVQPWPAVLNRNATATDDGYESHGSSGSTGSVVSSSAPSDRHGRDSSKRELLQGLISRSLRSASRALKTGPPEPPKAPEVVLSKLAQSRLQGRPNPVPPMSASPAPSSSSSPPRSVPGSTRSSGPAVSATTSRAFPAPSMGPEPELRKQSSHSRLSKTRSSSPSLSLFDFGNKQARSASPLSGQHLFSQRARRPSTVTSTSQDPVRDKTESVTTALKPGPFPRDSLLETTPILSQIQQLPTPPCSRSHKGASSAPKPALRLNRIMSSLSDDDVEKLFSGAPQYFARSEGHFTGAPHPSVAYPWDESLGIRDLTDHVQIEDPAWSNVTAWPHITRRCSPAMAETLNAIDVDAASVAGPDGGGRSTAKKRSHFYPRCRERPSMLSIQGLEKGTIGYEAALEMSVSDALLEDQYGFDALGPRPHAVVEARNNIMDPLAAAAAAQSAARAAEKGQANAIDESSGIKYVGETQILEELIKNGRRHADGSFYEPLQSKAFYNELFSHILRAPKKARSPSAHKRSSSQASTGHHLESELIPQIEALLDVLATPNVWIDFSHVEWRLRLGQLLWASSPDDDFDAGTASQAVKDAPTSRPATGDERYTERYWLLLQILLSTELLLRLDAITDGDEYGLEYVRPTEVHRFEKVANPSVRWSLILARAWLENIEVVRIDEDAEAAVKEARNQLDETKESLHGAATPKQKDDSVSKDGPLTKRHTVGWITTLTRKLSLIEGRLHTSRAPEKKHVYAMKARHATRQYRGIAHFAEELKWPNNLIDTIAQRAHTSNGGREPLNTKITKPACSAPDAHAEPKSQIEFSRKLMRRRKVVAGLHPGGWLSRSYLSGLMLPGDSVCNLLMSTLLEGDTDALETLGNVAHLGSGFVYRGKSFWSTACVVGRVLSAGAGAAECMGWVSSDVVPRSFGQTQGWVNVDANDVADDMKLVNRRARIWGKAAIERESSVLGDGESGSVLPGDFVIPYEAVYKEVPPQHTQIELQDLEFISGGGAAGGAAGGADLQAASVSFAMSSDGRPAKHVSYRLEYDVYFVTAHPCVPSQRVRVVKSPSSPTIQQIDVAGGSPGRSSSSTVQTTGHPLHKYFAYASVHLTTLIDSPRHTLEALLQQHLACTNRSAAAGAAKIDNAVLVIDCITGFAPQPAAHEMPMSPVTDTADNASISSFPELTKEISHIDSLPSVSSPSITAADKVRPTAKTAPPAANKMHHETRRRRFGSDMEILVRAICAERGWNALVSRRRRGCLACAIREAGALGWRVVIRVD